MAPIRLACPFLTGLLVYRANLRVRVPHPYVVLSLVLVAAFTMPVMGHLNWLFEAACVIVVFPFILMAGADNAYVEGMTGRVCRLAGELSYPVYIIHYPFIYIFAHWNWTTHPGKPRLAAVAVATVAGVLLLAHALSRWYDRPLRAWLSRAYLRHEATQTMALQQAARLTPGSTAGG